MPDIIASLLIRNLREVFGEPDAARRRIAIVTLFTEDAVFADAHGQQAGHAALDRKVGKLLARTPGWVFQAMGPAQAVHHAGRLAWGYGPSSEPPRVTGWISSWCARRRSRSSIPSSIQRKLSSQFAMAQNAVTLASEARWAAECRMPQCRPLL